MKSQVSSKIVNAMIRNSLNIFFRRWAIPAHVSLLFVITAVTLADVFQHCFIRSSIHWQFGSTLYSWKYRKDISNFKKWKILLQTVITIKRLTWTCIDHILKNIFKPFLIIAFIKCYCSDHKQEAPIWNKFIIRKDIIETSQVVLNILSECIYYELS
jgi:hypothetical protein